MAKNQTISYLQKRFAEIGIEPDSRRGQNFLIDINLQQLLRNAAQLTADDVVLEIGTGTGALTEIMAEQAGHVVSVEVDAHMHQLARELLVDRDNVTLLHFDALKNKNHFDPRVIETVQRLVAEVPGRRFKLAANLPYNIATPIITNLLTWPILPTSMTVTIQKELADRMTAVPSTKDFGSLSLWIQSQCQVEVVRILPPSVFWPRPKVTSAIIHLTIDAELRARLPDPEYFHNFVRAMFVHRRKFLRANVLGAMKGRLDKNEVDEIMQQNGFKADARAEQLDVETMIRFCESLRARVPDWQL